MDWKDIEVVEIVEEEIASPRTLLSDKTDTYSIPFRVSAVPPLKWVALFEKLWNNPPDHLQNHRPEIARLVGDKVILDDTNIDEIEAVHFTALQLIIDETNKQYADWLVEVEMYNQAHQAEQAFRGHIADVINRLPLGKQADMVDAVIADSEDEMVELNTEEQTNGYEQHNASEEYTNGHSNNMEADEYQDDNNETQPSEEEAEEQTETNEGGSEEPTYGDNLPMM